MNHASTEDKSRKPVTGHEALNSKKPKKINKLSRLALRSLSGLVVLILIGGIAAGVLAKQVSSVRSQLTHSVELVKQMRSQLEVGDRPASLRSLAQLEEQTSAAKSTTTGPLWSLASVIPLAGPNFGAVREVAVSADDLVAQAAVPLLQSYGALDWQALSPTNGQIDVAPLQEAAPDLVAAADTVQLSYARIASIDLSHVIPQIADPVRSAREQLQNVTEILTTVSSASKLLPSMLGAEKPQKYLILVQNSAESRATGGIAGAIAVLGTNDGRITLEDQSSASELGAFNPPLDVDGEQEALYTARLGTQMQNVNLTPDFPSAAQTAKQMWEERHVDETIDGVIALDPVVLSHLLAATGPVKLLDPEIQNTILGTSLPAVLTSGNVVQTLLSDVYREIEDPKVQDLFFSGVAAQIFSRFTDGEVDGKALVEAFAHSADENRLYLWSSHPSEQDIIASTPAHGSVTGLDGGGAAFGVYFNDGTGAKMDYYVSRSVQLIQSCPVGDYGRYTVRVTVTNNAPADAASSLPAYVTGGGIFGVEPGRVRTNYVMYGPTQSFVESARVNGETVPVGSGKHGQRPVGTVTQELAPGETAVLEVDFTRVVQDSEPHLNVTPSVQPIEDVVLPTIRTGTCQ